MCNLRENISSRTDRFNRYDWLLFALIVLAAYSVRLIYLYQIKGNPFFIPRSLDPLFYHSWAIRLVQGCATGDTVFQGMPLYAYFLGAVYKVFGIDVFAARAVQMFLASCACGMIYLAGSYSLCRVCGLIAAVCAVFYKPFIFYDGMIEGSSITVFLYILNLFAAMRFIHSFSRINAVLWGVLTGLAALARPGIMLFPIVTAIIYVLKFAEQRRYFLLIRFGIVIFLSLGVVSIATLRNYIVSGQFVFITAHSGLNYYIGNNETATGKFHAPDGVGRQSDKMYENSKRIAENELGRTLTPAQVSNYWKDKANQFIMRHPIKFLLLLGKKVYLFWQGGEISDFRNISFFRRFSALMRVALPSFYLIVPWAIIGMIASIGLNRNIPLMNCFFWSYFVSLLLYFINSRYRLPVVPVLMLFASYGFIFTANKLKTDRKSFFAFIAIAGVLYFILGFKMEEPNLADDYNELASWYMTDQSDYDKAIALYREALRLDPNNQYVYFNLGRAYFSVNRIDEALDVFGKAIKLDSNDYESINFYGILLSKKGMHRKSIDFFKRAVSIRPDYYIALNNMASVYRLMGDEANARITWQRSLNVNPNQPDIYLKLQ